MDSVANDTMYHALFPVPGESVSIASLATKFDWNCRVKFIMVEPKKTRNRCGVSGSTRWNAGVANTLFAFITINTTTEKIMIRKMTETVLDVSSQWETVWLHTV